MSTRGLVGTFIKNGERRKLVFIYNHSDSYLSYLGNNIIQEIKEAIKKNELEVLKKRILSGELTEESDLINIENINYLFHEYVYIIDFDNKLFYVFKTIPNAITISDELFDIEEIAYDGILLELIKLTFEEIANKEIEFTDDEERELIIKKLEEIKENF